MTMLRLPEPPAPESDCSLRYLSLVVPDRFREAVTRHHEHLAALATALEAAHIPAHEYRRHLDEAVESYRAQLLALKSATAESDYA